MIFFEACMEEKREREERRLSLEREKGERRFGCFWIIYEEEKKDANSKPPNGN